MRDSQKEATRRTRALPLIAVVGIHVVLITGFLISSRIPWRFVDSSDSIVMILLPQSLSRPETTPLKREVAARPKNSRRTEVRAPEPQPQTNSAESTAPVALPPIDWQLEGEHAAARKALAAPWQPAAGDKKQHKAEFGWSHARTHRIEKDLESGVAILNLNDHCVLVGLIIPMCGVGKIKPRGDLLDGMKDPDPPSSVPDAPTQDVLNFVSKEP
jgi:hypothetical protein